MKTTARIIALGILLLWISSVATAQTTRGTLAGVVTDSTGAVVNGAKVTATPTTGGEPRSTTTGSTGEYRIELLNPGIYTVSVEAQGFALTKVENVNVRSTMITANNVQVNLASKSETVQVEANTDQIQTESGELSKTIPTVQVKDIPISSGNPFALATTLPGVVTVASRDDFTNGTSFSVNGLRPRSNNFLIDGFDDNDNNIGGQAFQPANQEAVQEVTVLTNSYSAEYGRGGASVSNLSFRSGSNNLHGAAWESYDGSRLDAVSPEASGQGLTRVPQYVNNTFGFRVGGPAIKNKLFFFGTSQWNRNFGAPVANGAPLASKLVLPTANGVAALQSIGANQNVQILLNTMGNVRGQGNFKTINIGNRPGCGSPCLIEVGDFTRFDSTASKSREWTVRGDYTPTSNDTIYARYTDTYSSFTPDLFANSAALPNIDTFQGGPSRLLGTMWGHTFNSTTINEFRFSAQNFDFTFAPTAATLANPNANLPGLALAASFGNATAWGGFNQGGFPQGRGHQTYQFQDAVAFTRGRHSLKVGTDLAVLLVKDQIPFNSAGLITYSSGGDCSSIGLTKCTDLANYIDGFSGPTGTLSKQFGNPRVNVPTTQQSYYFQDSWKMRPNITLDFGLRYEYQPPDASNVLPFPAVNRATALTDPFQTRVAVEPDRNNFGPRFGFAYSPHFWKGLFGEDRTVIRGGYGVFYDTFFTNIADNTAASAPNTLGGTQTGDGTGSSTNRGQADALTFVNKITPTISQTDRVDAVTSNLRNPQIHQWNLSVQRELPLKLLFEVAYVGTRGERLWVNEQLNPVDVNTGDRLNPNRGQIVVRGNRGDSIYHGLQTTVSHNYKSLSLRGSYTWSRAIDNQSEVFATSSGASRWMILNDPRSDRGPSAFHRTHRASISYVYELPRYKGHGVLSAALGGWASSGQIGFQSGAPQTVYIGGWDQNGDGEGFNDRPVLSNPAVPIDYTNACLTATTFCSGVGQVNPDGSIIDWVTGADTINGQPITQSNVHYLIYPQGSGVNGTVGRNSFYFPGRQDWNLSAFKRFYMPYREGHILEFRADFFNAFNHSNLGVRNLDANLGSATFNDIERTRSGARNITVWLKYTF